MRRNISAWSDYHFMDGVSGPPKAVVFKINNICNMNCKMCNYSNAGYFSEGKILPETIFKRVMDEIYQNVPVIVITGGEPLITKNFYNYLRYTKEHKMICTMVTNGWYLKECAAEIVKSKIDLLSISIDGPRSVHDNIRRKRGAYDRALLGIKEVASYKKRPMLVVSSIIQAENFKFLDKLVDDLKGTGIDAMNFQVLWTRHPKRTKRHNILFPEFQVGDGWIDETILNVEFDELEKVLDKVKKEGILINIFPPFDIQEIREWYTNPKSFLVGSSLKCPWMWGIIFQDGTMRMCDDIVLGDLNEEGFWAIWNGERMVEFRRTLKESKRFPICAGCCNLLRNSKI
jgi:MoaA/NifB/PqqE/SkfB family radical SAM enzyme